MEKNKRELIEKMLRDPKAWELMKGKDRPKNPEEEITVYAEIARELGLNLTAEDIGAYIRHAEQACRDRTEKAADMVQELPDEELDQVAGGKDNPSCMETYQDYENCWYTDGCDNIFQIYNEYICHRGFYTDHCHEVAVPCDHDYYYQN